MLDLEVQSLRFVVRLVLEPLVRAALPPVRAQVLGVLKVYADKAETGPRNAKRYHFERGLYELWTKLGS